MYQCSTNAITGTFERSINSISNYANTISNDAQTAVTGTAFRQSINDLGNAVNGLQSGYSNIVNNVVTPLSQAYNSVNGTMIDNMAAFAEMTEAMKSKRSATLYFYENGVKVARRVGVDSVGSDVYEAVDSIPTYSEMQKAMSEVKSAKAAVQNASPKAKNDSKSALEKVQSFERLVGKLAGERVSVNGLIQDVDALHEANKYLNMDQADLPPAVSTAANIAALKPALDAFMMANNVQRINQLMEFAQTLNAIAQLQSLQNAAFTTMATATQLADNIQKIGTIMGALSLDKSSIKDMYNAQKNAKHIYEQTKSQVGDLKKDAQLLKKVANDISNIKNGFQQDLANIKNMFSGSVSIYDLLQTLDTFPGMSGVVNEVTGYLNITGRAQNLRSTVLGFGSDAQSTQAVMNTAKPYVDKAKVEVKQWGEDVKNHFAKSDADASDLNKTRLQTSKHEQTAKRLEANSNKYKQNVERSKQNLDYLIGVYQTDKAAVAKLKNARSKLDNIAKHAQLKEYALDTLGVTQASHDVVNAYEAVTRLDKDRLMGPIGNLQNSFERFSDVENQLSDVKKLASNISNAKQVVNGLQNNLQNLGGFLQCFNIDVDAVLKDLLYRVGDYLVDELKLKVWNAYSEVVVEVPYLMLPPEHENKFHQLNFPQINNYLKEKPFYESKVQEDLQKLAGYLPETELSFEGARFAQATSITDFNLGQNITVDTTQYDFKLDYTDSMSAHDVEVLPNISVRAGMGIEWDFEDWKTTAWLPFVGSLQCGFSLKDDFCWYWRWKSCGFISKCYKVPYLLPACMTNFDYKEPVAQVEVVGRSGTSHLLYNKFLRDIPTNVEDSWGLGGNSAVPAVHVVGMSPQARAISGLGILESNLTMTCDIAKKLDKWPYVQFYGLPSAPMELAKQLGRSLVDLKDWKKEWYTEDAPEMGMYPASLQALYMSEIHRGEWNPRTFPNGETPSGETIPNFEANRKEAYKWALPYTDHDPSGTTVVGNIKMNKCDAGLPSDGTNRCIGDWGALMPRNGQVATEDPQYPLKKYALLAYRAYDRALEKGVFDDLKVQEGVSYTGVNYDRMEFNLDWPYQTKRYPVGTDPRVWAKGYFGEKLNSGGMVMTLWKDTSCCVKACCDYSKNGFYPGESYYFTLPFWEDEKWKITDVTKHK